MEQSTRVRVSTAIKIYIFLASRGAQKLAPILILLRDVVNCNMRVVLSAVEKHSDMPVKNFYRFVIEPELTFQPDGKLSAGPLAKFVGLPASPLLTQNLQVRTITT